MDEDGDGHTIRQVCQCSTHVDDADEALGLVLCEAQHADLPKEDHEYRIDDLLDDEEHGVFGYFSATPVVNMNRKAVRTTIITKVIPVSTVFEEDFDTRYAVRGMLTRMNAPTKTMTYGSASALRPVAPMCWQ